MKLTVKLNDLNAVKGFVDITSQFSENISLVHERFVVDAKSILGIFSMDLSAPLELVCERENNRLANELSGFLVA